MKYLSLTIFLLVSGILLGQNNRYLADPIESFSKKRTAYFTLTDGSEVEGTIKKLKRKKWLFEEITVTTESGDKVKFGADEIKSMYLPQSGLGKLDSSMEFMNDMTAWGRTDLNKQYLEDGYAYFESTELYYKKKKKQTMLVQLLNPSYSDKICIYHDPTANESGMAVGGMKVSGGDKSYYIKVGDNVAYKLKKKDFKEQRAELFGGCDFGVSVDDIQWKHFAENLLKYSEACN